MQERPATGPLDEPPRSIAERFTDWRRHYLPLPDEVVSEYLGADEYVIHTDHPSFRAFLLKNIFQVTIATLLVPVVFAFVRMDLEWWWILLIVLGLDLVLLMLAIKRLGDRYTSYVITNLRLIRVSGIIGRKLASIPWTRMTGLGYRQKPIGRLMGFATIFIESANEESGLREFSDINDPAAFHQLILDMVSSKGGPKPDKPTKGVRKTLWQRRREAREAARQAAAAALAEAEQAAAEAAAADADGGAASTPAAEPGSGPDAPPPAAPSPAPAAPAAGVAASPAAPAAAVSTPPTAAPAATPAVAATTPAAPSGPAASAPPSATPPTRPPAGMPPAVDPNGPPTPPTGSPAVEPGAAAAPDTPPDADAAPGTGAPLGAAGPARPRRGGPPAGGPAGPAARGGTGPAGKRARPRTAGRRPDTPKPPAAPRSPAPPSSGTTSSIRMPTGERPTGERPTGERRPRESSGASDQAPSDREPTGERPPDTRRPRGASGASHQAPSNRGPTGEQPSGTPKPHAASPEAAAPPKDSATPRRQRLADAAVTAPTDSPARDRRAGTRPAGSSGEQEAVHQRAARHRSGSWAWPGGTRTTGDDAGPVADRSTWDAGPLVDRLKGMMQRPRRDGDGDEVVEKVSAREAIAAVRRGSGTRRNLTPLRRPRFPKFGRSRPKPPANRQLPPGTSEQPPPGRTGPPDSDD